MSARLELSIDLADLFTEWWAAANRVQIWEDDGEGGERLTERAQVIYDNYENSMRATIEDVLGPETERESLGYEDYRVRKMPLRVAKKLIDQLVELFKEEGRQWHLRKRWGVNPKRLIEKEVFTALDRRPKR